MNYITNMESPVPSSLYLLQGIWELGSTAGSALALQTHWEKV